MDIEYLGPFINSIDRWSIDGVEIHLSFCKEISREMTRRVLGEYRKLLAERQYEKDRSLLPKIFRFLGGIAFVRVGMVYREAFLLCFSFFADLFAEEWKAGAERIHSKEIGCGCVFSLMLSDGDAAPDYNVRYILGETEDSHIFCELVDRAFEKVWAPQVAERMKSGRTLSDICYRLGVVRICRYMSIAMCVEKYLAVVTGEFTAGRKKISLAKLYGFIFGEGVKMSYEVCGIKELCHTVVQHEERLQYEKFPSENRKAMSDNNIWILYKQKGLELRSLKLDFNTVNSPGMRSEIRSFCRFRYSGNIRTDDTILVTLAGAVNRISKMNPVIHFFADIGLSDVKALQLLMESESVSQCMIAQTFSACRSAVDYLRGDDREPTLRTPVPAENYFRKICFVNSSRYSENTPYIPDGVMAALERHIDELSARDALIFRIMNETAMRSKEVSLLEADCLREARYDGWVKLVYIPYKVLSACRRAGAGDYHSVYISAKLAADIRDFAVETKELREEYSLPYLFLQKKQKRTSSLIDMTGFTRRVNRLIEKHGINDQSGRLWHYTNRQCRKTVVVNMVENGAVTEELVYMLGHLSRTTALKYYAEVKSMRLAELNSEFFRHQFESVLSVEQLDRFSEEERKQLYVDFRLGLRRVELGFCLKKPGSGRCRNTTSLYHCASCPELCTGEAYLSHWKKLLESEEAELGRLISLYEAKGITEYKDYTEFRKRTALADAYRSVVSRLTKGGGDT